ncbi:MAG: hypothetical protein WD068_01075 [Candidatus Babeliales bacterium]
MEQLNLRALRDAHAYDKQIAIELFSEADIIELHNRFITPGFHLLNVKSIIDGRALIYKLLTSLNCHHTIATVAITACSFEPFVTNIIDALGASEAITEQILFDYFLDEFDADFFWIEMTHELMAQSWFGVFEQMLYDFNLQQHIPIIMLSYER